MAPKKKFGSLRDLQNDNGSSGHGHGHDDDEDKDQEFYTGGDKSGLAVQEPGSSSRDQINRLLETARRNGPPPPREEDDEPPPSAFTGQGQTLGGDDVPSEIIPDPDAHRHRPAPMVERTLHLWADGFSVDDGELYRYDDPANARTLDMINRGSAPLDIMNVEQGQAVDVKLEHHRGEDYVAPKKKYKAFSGSGQRLGSPAPAVTSSAAPSVQPAVDSPAPAELDDALPTIALQIRLADGTRLPSRFNATHTVGDVYDFVDRSTPGGGRPYALATTFPTKELSDREKALGDFPEFRRGGVLVQKWT